MTKFETITEHVVVTFFEAGVAYLIVIPTVNWNRTVLAGAIGAGMSAVYNWVRQSTPTANLQPTVAEPTVVTPEVPTVTPPTEPVISPVTTEIPVVTDEPTLNQPGN